jgi:NAD(P)H-nitrite reductase large subunit
VSRATFEEGQIFWHFHALWPILRDCVTVTESCTNKGGDGMKHHLILGAGPAALNALETIRYYDHGASRITLVCDEPPYVRSALPRYLAGQVPQMQLFAGDQIYFNEFQVDCRFGQRVVSLQPDLKQVTLKGGGTLAFDDLLIATGSSPVLPKIPGIDLPGVQPIWTMDHAEALLQAAEDKLEPEVLFLGAGFMGFTVVNALFQRGWKIHLVETATRLLPRMLDAPSAALLAKWLKKNWVRLYLGTTAAAITQTADRPRVKLASGMFVEVDAVIVATGRHPNLDCVADAGLQQEQGLLVNDRMQTNIPFIYAAGDVAQGPDLLGGPSAWHALQPTAVDQGRIAGANMAGKEVRYPGSLFLNVLDACGLQCISIGQWDNQTAEKTVIQIPDRPVYRKLLWTGTQLAGAVFVAPPSEESMLPDIGMVKGFIQAKTQFGAWKEYLRENPFDLRRPYMGLRVAQKLAETALPKPPSSLKYRFRHLHAAPQVPVPQEQAP